MSRYPLGGTSIVPPRRSAGAARRGLGMDRGYKYRARGGRGFHRTLPCRPANGVSGRGGQAEAGETERCAQQGQSYEDNQTKTTQRQKELDWTFEEGSVCTVLGGVYTETLC
eukprot:EG_transcript_19440